VADLSKAKRKWAYRALLERDGPWCRYCGVLMEDGVPKRRMTIDHILARVKGGTSRLSNLLLACYACNQAKGDDSYWDYMESDYCAERRATVRGHMDVHGHEAILFNRSGNWSCLCGACGTPKDSPVATPCTLWTYAAFYRPSNLVDPAIVSEFDWDHFLQTGEDSSDREDPHGTPPMDAGEAYPEEAPWYQGDWVSS